MRRGKIVRFVLIAAALAMCFCLTACGNKYSSSYYAVGMTRTSTSTKSTLYFKEFDGRFVFKMKAKEDKNALSYSAELGVGKIKITYDCLYENTYEVLLDAAEGEGKREGVILPDPDRGLPSGTVYVIVESEGVCENGTFSFSLVENEQAQNF